MRPGVPQQACPRLPAPQLVSRLCVAAAAQLRLPPAIVSSPSPAAASPKDLHLSALFPRSTLGRRRVSPGCLTPCGVPPLLHVSLGRCPEPAGDSDRAPLRAARRFPLCHDAARAHRPEHV